MKTKTAEAENRARCWLVGIEAHGGSYHVVEARKVGEVVDGLQTVNTRMHCARSEMLVTLPVEQVHDTLESAEMRRAEYESTPEPTTRIGFADAPMFECAVVYDCPSDYPHFAVVRRWSVDTAGNLVAAEKCQLAASIEDARRLIPAGWKKLQPMEGEDPAISEVWVDDRAFDLPALVWRALVGQKEAGP